MRSSEKEIRLRRLESQKGLRQDKPQRRHPLQHCHDLREKYDTPEKWEAWTRASCIERRKELKRFLEGVSGEIQAEAAGHKFSR